jgi:hypothetical protein
MKNQKLSVIKVDYDELEDTINEYFKEFHGFDPIVDDNQSFEFVAMKECGNYQSHLFENVNGELSKDDLGKLQKVIEKKDFYEAQWRVDIFLNYLCSKSVIESGNYLVKVYW